MDYTKLREGPLCPLCSGSVSKANLGSSSYRGSARIFFGIASGSFIKFTLRFYWA